MIRNDWLFVCARARTHKHTSTHRSQESIVSYTILVPFSVLFFSVPVYSRLYAHFNISRLEFILHLSTFHVVVGLFILRLFWCLFYLFDININGQIINLKRMAHMSEWSRWTMYKKHITYTYVASNWPIQNTYKSEISNRTTQKKKKKRGKKRH